MEICPLTLADYEAVYALWLATPGMGLNDLDDSREGFARYLRRNPGTCFAAWEGERLVGVILSGHDGRRGYLYHLAVCVEECCRGIGSRLLECAMQALEQEGICKVALVVFAHNQLGNGFWEKHGFTVREDLVYRNRTIHELRRIDT